MPGGGWDEPTAPLGGQTSDDMSGATGAGTQTAGGQQNGGAPGGAGVGDAAVIATGAAVGPLGDASVGTTRPDLRDGGVESDAAVNGVEDEPGSYGVLKADEIGAPVMLKKGFTLAESPLWDPCNHQLLFTDVQGGAGQTGVIHALGASGDLSVFMAGTTNANGIAFDIDGSLILSQMGSGGHLSRRDKAGQVTLLEPTGGPRLHTPDDVIVRSDGTIYFSDGDFYPIGNLLGSGNTLPIYMLKPGASALVPVGSVSGPNGIEFSPDEKTLYVSAYGDGAVVPFSVADDGMLTKGKPLASGGSSDSMCVDAAGNLYVAVKTGLQVMTAGASKIKLIPIPGSTLTTGTTSCGFGGDDGKTLYITSWTTLYKVDNMPIPGQDWLANRKRLGCTDLGPRLQAEGA